ncbi:MAG: response regulator [Bacteroidetes bacterium]|nr:response regulator [Bacteroidota bacterium]MBU1719357.1 response regulator [Bacteroidota bacterium]
MASQNTRRRTPRKKTIFIVEDNEVYAASLKAFLHTRFTDIKEIMIFSNGETCLSELRRKPGFLIIDYYLNSHIEEAQNGLEIIKQIRAQASQTNIIVLSSQKNLDVILDAIREYDCNYVQKDEDAFNTIERTIQETYLRKNQQVHEWQS